MLGIFKSDPTKKLRKQYDATIEKAMYAQRSGNIELFSELTAESEKIWQQIELIKSKD